MLTARTPKAILASQWLQSDIWDEFLLPGFFIKTSVSQTVAQAVSHCDRHCTEHADPGFLTLVLIRLFLNLNVHQGLLTCSKNERGTNELIGAQKACDLPWKRKQNRRSVCEHTVKFAVISEIQKVGSRGQGGFVHYQPSTGQSSAGWSMRASQATYRRCRRRSTTATESSNAVDGSGVIRRMQSFSNCPT